MRQPAARGETDANQADLVRCYEELGCTVADLHAVGGGVPDLLIGCVGRDQLVEVKMPGADLIASQKTFTAVWRGSKPIVVRTREDVIAHVQAMRRSVRGP